MCPRPRVLHVCPGNHGGPWWRASAAAARGQAECPGKAGGALQQAAASGRATSGRTASGRTASDWTASERATDAA